MSPHMHSGAHRSQRVYWIPWNRDLYKSSQCLMAKPSFNPSLQFLTFDEGRIFCYNLGT